MKLLLTMVSLEFLYRLSRILGLHHFQYAPKAGRIRRDKGLIRIYCIVLHLIYVLIMTFFSWFMLPKYYHCQKLDMLAIAYSVVSIAKIITVLIVISSIWLLSSQWLQVLNGFMMFQQIYRKELSGRDNLWQHVWKLVLTLSHFSLIFTHLFGPPSIFICDNFDEPRGRLAPLYVMLSLGIVLMEVLLTSVDYLVYYLINLSNRVVGCISEETQKQRKDLSWLLHRRGSYHNVYQHQLYAVWHKLWRRCLRLDRLINELMKISQWHILLNLFSSYLCDTTYIFNIVIYSTESDHFHLPRLMSYMLLGTLFHWDIMTYFRIFGINRLQWSHLLTSMEELWLTLGFVDFDPRTDIYGIALHRQMSFAIISINRRQHRRQDRVRRLQIAGFFDMNPRSGYSMSTNIIMNVVILWQIAYKYYY